MNLVKVTFSIASLQYIIRNYVLRKISFHGNYFSTNIDETRAISISDSFQNKMIPIDLYPVNTYLDVVRPQTRSELFVDQLFPGGRSGFHFHWLSESIKKKKC